MKNFLIPTTFEIDTISAVKSAINQAKNTNCEIILMMVSDTPDSFSSAQFLREMRTELTKSQKEVLETCRYIIEHTANCKLKVHNQYGLSVSVFKGIIDAFDVKLVVLTHSYKQETKRIHQYLVKLAGNQKCPILHLGTELNEGDFNKALYIENASANIHVKDVQQFLSANFSFEIVSQTAHFDDDYEQFAPYLSEAISKYNIDLLVETRKGEKIKFKKSKKENVNDRMGLPVLSLYEELA
ncbi:universal stress protein [Flavobacterium sp. W22_SRS_FK3]|uniref:universal stress protein n=1 Tax=Flavobacterium sp. W22_SRS_FK3 TaxID=3240275 RepID=UPI003F90AD32